VAVLSYQHLDVVEMHADRRLKIEGVSKEIHLAVLMTTGKLCFFKQKDFSLSYAISLQREITQVVFESSSRFLAALTTDRSVEVWNLKATEPSNVWNLNFKSVAQVQPSRTENQFYLTMSSSDSKMDQPDSVLLF
jgi:hypothetical protein